MDKIILLTCLICCCIIVRAENKKGLMEAIFGSTAMQMSNLGTLKKDDSIMISEKNYQEKFFPPLHPDTIKIPIPTFQTVVIHRPHPEPIHIHKPPKEHVIIHEAKPHENHYYFVKPHGHDEKPIPISHESNHNIQKPTHGPGFVAFDHRPSHDTHNYKPSYVEQKPVYLSLKPEHNNHDYNKPHFDQIFVNKPAQHDNKPTNLQHLYKPVHENHDTITNLYDDNKPYSENKPNVIIQFVSDKPYQTYKPEIIHVNPNNPFHNFGPIQFAKPTEAHHADNEKPIDYPVFIQDLFNPSHPIKDHKLQNDHKHNDHESSEYNYQDASKKPANLWELITKPFQSSNQDQYDDEACNDDSVTKPLKCIFRAGTPKKNSSDSLSYEKKRNEIPQHVSLESEVHHNSQLPVLPSSFFPQFWVTRPLLQKQKSQSQNDKIVGDAIIDEEDDDEIEKDKIGNIKEDEVITNEDTRSYRQGRNT